MSNLVGCEVWWARPEPDLAGLTRLLDVAERARYARLHFPADRLRFLVGRALLRIVLGGRLGVRPESVRITTRCAHCGCVNGKPRLADEPGPGFSVSHSGTRVVVAVADTAADGEMQVGVDVEQISNQIDDRAFDHMLSSAERRRITEGPHVDRLPGFFVTWTRKEAVLKAAGYGLSVPPSAVEVSPPSHPPRLMRWSAPRPLPGPVQLCDLNPGPGHAASLAVLSERSCRVDQLDAHPLLLDSAARRQP